jgi:hypothetical protein
VKTDRRDGELLATSLLAGQLKPVVTPVVWLERSVTSVERGVEVS